MSAIYIRVIKNDFYVDSTPPSECIVMLLYAGFLVSKGTNEVRKYIQELGLLLHLRPCSNAYAHDVSSRCLYLLETSTKEK